jgi:hypothetical protein
VGPDEKKKNREQRRRSAQSLSYGKHAKKNKEIQLHTVIQDQSNNWGIRPVTGQMVRYQKCKPIQKVQTLSSIIKKNKNIQR